MTTEPVYFGDCFGDELAAAGLGGLPLVWYAATGEITGRDQLTEEQNATLDQVIAAHDPTCSGTQWERK